MENYLQAWWCKAIITCGAESFRAIFLQDYHSVLINPVGKCERRGVGQAGRVCKGLRAFMIGDPHVCGALICDSFLSNGRFDFVHAGLKS